MKNIIVPTGYMGSGSSAITNILSEIEIFDNRNGDFEFIFLHCPDGLFDLEDKLLLSNNALRSDESIYRFKKQMRELYNNTFFWAGGYKNNISIHFYEYAEQFIDNITCINIPCGHWYFSEMPHSVRMKAVCLLDKILRKITLNRLHIKKNPIYNGMTLAFPSQDEFYSNARLFISDVLDSFDGDTLVLDQFLLPHNLYRMSNYFDGTCKAIVVERDPRDVFLANKYIWIPNGIGDIPIPTDVFDFCKYYRRMRESEIIIVSDNILRVKFEDLIYNYEASLREIYLFLGIDETLHTKKKKVFNPNISINNTQLFKVMNDKKEEIEVIEHELSEYLYVFPKTISVTHDLKECF